MIALYLSGAAAVGFHLQKGWSKTVLKMDLTKTEMEVSKAIGNAMILPLCGGFASIPLWLWALQQPDITGLIGLPAQNASMIINATGGTAVPHTSFLSFIPFL